MQPFQQILPVRHPVLGDGLAVPVGVEPVDQNALIAGDPADASNGGAREPGQASAGGAQRRHGPVLGARAVQRLRLVAGRDPLPTRSARARHARGRQRRSRAGRRTGGAPCSQGTSLPSSPAARSRCSSAAKAGPSTADRSRPRAGRPSRASALALAATTVRPRAGVSHQAGPRAAGWRRGGGSAPVRRAPRRSDGSAPGGSWVAWRDSPSLPQRRWGWQGWEPVPGDRTKTRDPWRGRPPQGQARPEGGRSERAVAGRHRAGRRDGAKGQQAGARPADRRAGVLPGGATSPARSARRGAAGAPRRLPRRPAPAGHSSSRARAGRRRWHG